MLHKNFPSISCKLFSNFLQDCADVFPHDKNMQPKHIDNFKKEHEHCIENMDDILNSVNEFRCSSAEKDETFKLFRNALDDWEVYELMYIAIRSGSYSKRTTGIVIYNLNFFFREKS